MGQSKSAELNCIPIRLNRAYNLPITGRVKQGKKNQTGPQLEAQGDRAGGDPSLKLEHAARTGNIA